MSRPNVTVKSVHFNVKNADDAKMLKSFSRKNFSRYVKKLIMADIQQKEQQKKDAPTRSIKEQGEIKFTVD